jgi:hypothetical protein
MDLLEIGNRLVAQSEQLTADARAAAAELTAEMGGSAQSDTAYALLVASLAQVLADETRGQRAGRRSQRIGKAFADLAQAVELHLANGDRS